MNSRALALVLAASLTGTSALAHVIGEPAHDATARRFAREFSAPALALAAAPVAVRTALFVSPALPAPPLFAVTPAAAAPPQAAAFAKFAPTVRIRWDDTHLHVESSGLPAHGMMTGITAWQQQVPLPQPYTGANAWRIPLRPMPAAQPVLIRDRFLRGAVALAANGIPIFNPQNNRGELSAEIGELDRWGGHCGRADDYHYHVAPLHLADILGPRLPLAYALDGYPIHGLTEPDGSKPTGLDVCNGHSTPELGYHYHASNRYPYVNGGFHGVVVEREEQVDPQPRAQGVRPALTALRGARITGFTAGAEHKDNLLTYTVGDRPASIRFVATAPDTWHFTFTDPAGKIVEATYRAGDRRGGSGPDAGKRKGGNADRNRPALRP